MKLGTGIFYNEDTKVATAGSTYTLHRISIRLDEDGRRAVESLRNGKEPLCYPLAKVIDAGVKAVLSGLEKGESE